MGTSNSKKKKKPLSPDAREVWFQLDGLTRQQIRKANPLKQARNQRIRELRASGLKVEILAELTGLQRGAISRICKEESAIPDYAKQEVKALSRAFESVLKSLSRLLNDHVKDEKEEKGTKDFTGHKSEP
jgi:transcriptional regulator with XRE-family HTH domain